MKVEFVDSQRETHGVQPVLRALEGTPAHIAPSTCCAAKTRPPSARAARDQELIEKIIVMSRRRTTVRVQETGGSSTCTLAHADGAGPVPRGRRRLSLTATILLPMQVPEEHVGAAWRIKLGAKRAVERR